MADTFSLPFGASSTMAGDVLMNDTGSSLSATVVSQPSHGTLSLSTGFAYYTQTDFSFVGNDTATYQASDGVDSSNANITFQVAHATTTTSLNTGWIPAYYGETISLTATVTSTQAPSVPTGSVTFSDGTTNLATVNLNSSGAAVFSTSSLAVGGYSISAHYTATGVFANSPWDAYALVYIYANTTPTLDAIDDQESAEGDEIELETSTYDPDTQALTFSASGLPQGLSINASTGVIAGTIAFNAGDANDGVHEVTVTVTDTSGAYDSQSFTWTVDSVLWAVEPQTWELDAEVWLAVPFHNPDEEAPTFAADDLPSGLSIDADTGVISGIPDEYATGTAVITVTLGDREDTLEFDWAVISTPTVTPPGEQWTNLNTALVLSTTNENPITIGSNYGSSTNLTVDLQVSSGTLTLASTTGLTFTTGDGTTDSAMIFSGTVTAINTALDGLIYTPVTNFQGEPIITIAVTDPAHLDVFADPLVSVNEVGIALGGPVILVPDEQSTNSSQPLIFDWSSGNGIYIIDPPAGEEGLQVDLEIDDGTLTLGSTDGLTFITGDGENDAVMCFTGSLDAVNMALAGLIYTPSANYVGDASLVIVATDLGTAWGSGQNDATETANIHVGGPMVTVPEAQWSLPNTTVIFSSANNNAITVGDDEAGSGDLQVDLSVATGTLSLATTSGLTFLVGDGTNDAAMSFTGSVSAINAALNGLGYTFGVAYDGTDEIAIHVDDQGNYWSGGVQSASASVLVYSTFVAVIATEPEDESGAIGAFALSRSADLGNSLTLYYTVSGTAAPNDGFGNGDYEPLTGSVTFAADEDVVIVNIDPIEGGDYTDGHTVIITLTPSMTSEFFVAPNWSSSEYVLSHPVEAPTPIVAISATTTEVEDSFTGPVTFTVYRQGDVSEELTVDYEVSGTAIAGEEGDYLALSGSVTFAEGEGTAEIAVTLTNNPAEGWQSLIITLQNPLDESYEVAEYSESAEIDIVGETIAVGIEVTDTEVTRGSNETPTFVISRAEAGTHDLTVTLIVSGDAEAGVHYDTLPLATTILAGETSVIVPLDVLDDGVIYGERTVTVTLVAGNYEIISSGEASVVLFDNEEAVIPLVTIAATDDYATELDEESEDPVDTATFTITRTGPTTEALTVYYEIGGTATADVEYEALTGSVTILAGHSTAIITVNPLELAGEPEELEQTLELTLVEAENPADYQVAAENAPQGYFARVVITLKEAATAPAGASTVSAIYQKSLPIYRDPTLTGVFQDLYSPNQSVTGIDDWPIAYSIGDKAKITLRFRITSTTAPFLLAPIWVRGRADAEINAQTPVIFKAGLATLDKDKTTFTVTLETTQPFATVTYNDKFWMNWEFSLKGENAQDADWKYVKNSGVTSVTKCHLFVTYQKPLNSVKQVYISALWQGCKFGAGTTKGTTVEEIAAKTAELIKKIWEGGLTTAGASSFARQSVSTYNGTGNGTALSYYKSWKQDELGLNFMALLSKKDGNCDSWAQYFNLVLRSQGIESKVVTIQVDSAKLTDKTMNKFMIQNWQVQGPQQKRYYNVLDTQAAAESKMFTRLTMKKVEGK